MPFAATQRDLDIIILNEVSQKDTIQMNLFIKQKQTHGE